MLNFYYLLQTIGWFQFLSSSWFVPLLFPPSLIWWRKDGRRYNVNFRIFVQAVFWFTTGLQFILALTCPGCNIFWQQLYAACLFLVIWQNKEYKVRFFLSSVCMPLPSICVWSARDQHQVMLLWLSSSVFVNWLACWDAPIRYILATMDSVSTPGRAVVRTVVAFGHQGMGFFLTWPTPIPVIETLCVNVWFTGPANKRLEASPAEAVIYCPFWDT